MYQSKAAIQSLGVTGPLFSMLVIALNMFGIDIGKDVVGAADMIARIIDNGMILAGLAVGIYGRVTATKEITSVFKKPD